MMLSLIENRDLKKIAKSLVSVDHALIYMQYESFSKYYFTKKGLSQIGKAL